MSNRTVIFICVHNSARSQIAEAFAKKYAGDLFERVESAGLESGTLNPIVVEAMKEKGIDISGNRTKEALEFLKSDTHFDYVVTVCDQANAERCPIFPGRNTRITWSFRDPSAIEGDHDKKLAITRVIRDEIEETVKNWAESLRLKEGIV